MRKKKKKKRTIIDELCAHHNPSAAHHSIVYLMEMTFNFNFFHSDNETVWLSVCENPPTGPV